MPRGPAASPWVRVDLCWPAAMGPSPLAAVNCLQGLTLLAETHSASARPSPRAALDRLDRLARSLATGLGYAIWGVEFTAGHHRAVARIYLDLPGNEHLPSGPDRPEVDVDQCAEFSRHLSVALDAEDVIPGAYTLEVSSPGMERLFFRLEQLPPYVGRELSVQLDRPLQGPAYADPWYADRKRLRGRLLAVEQTTLTLDSEGHTPAIPWAQVKQCRLIHEFEAPKKPKGGSSKKKSASPAPGAPGAPSFPEHPVEEDAS